MDIAGNAWPNRLWRRASLMQRMMVVALVPTLITAALLVALLTQRQLATLRDLSRNNAEAIAIQTASVSVQPLRSQQLRELLRIANSIGELPHVTRVQIRTADGQILADHRESGRGTAAPEILTVVHNVTDDQSDTPTVLGSVLVDVSLHDAIAAQNGSLRHALLALLLSLLIAGVIGWQAARWISAPLRHLAGAVHELGRGEREVTVTVTDRTEIGELQQGFNHAAAALRDIQLGMEQQIAQATRDLASKNTALEAASAARARFLAAASHDLRQPLYALTLLSSALAVDEHDPVRLNRIAHLQECVHSLDQLFSELLDLSRLESGAVEVELSDFPLDPVLFEVIRSFDMVAEQRGLQLRGRHTGHWVRGDRGMLVRMLHNLVSNALRYTHLGGALLGARADGAGGVRIEVWDTGSGISPEHLHNVFDEFYRIDDRADAHGEDGSHSGLGLGLATAQRLAELMDTRVQVKSRMGRGSLFHFRLPSATAPAPRVKPARDVSTEIGGRRVLVMDNDPAILSGIGFLLRSWGCDVAVAEDRLQALEAIENWPGPADLVISDLHLRAGESALQVFAELDERYRQDGEKPFARLLITGETRPAQLHEIIAARIPLLHKPVSPQQLASAMASALAMPRR